MTASWNDLPIEIRVMIINEMDFISRAKLSACAKLEQQLVRKSACKMEEIEIERPFIFLKDQATQIRIRISNVKNTFVWKNPVKPNISKIDEPRKKILKNTTWETTVLNIFNTIGSKCLVERFNFTMDMENEENIEWFRKNVKFEPREVEAVGEKYSYDTAGFDLDPYLEWPQNVNITCQYSNFDGPVLERLNSYDNIICFSYLNSSDENGGVTDAKLMKLENATSVNILDCPVTLNGITRWIKQWLTRQDFDKMYFFANFDENQITDLEIKAELDDFIKSFEKNGEKSNFKLQNQSNGKVAELELRKYHITFSRF